MQNARFVVYGVEAGYKTYSIKNVSFILNSGDIMGLLGRSGAGKSTIISALTGIRKPIKGSIKLFVNNKEVPIREYLGYSPQANALYSFLTVKENVMTFASLYGVPKKIAYERMNYLFKRLMLSGNENKRITQLSGGMKKKVDLVITLIHDPLLLILDEPFAGLDISLQVFLWNFIKELARQGKIIIIASHLINSIQTHCNKFALVENGYYYNNNQLITSLIKSRETSLEDFLVKVFSRGGH